MYNYLQMLVDMEGIRTALRSKLSIISSNDKHLVLILKADTPKTIYILNLQILKKN